MEKGDVKLPKELGIDDIQVPLAKKKTSIVNLLRYNMAYTQKWYLNFTVLFFQKLVHFLLFLFLIIWLIIQTFRSMSVYKKTGLETVTQSREGSQESETKSPVSSLLFRLDNSKFQTSAWINIKEEFQFTLILLLMYAFKYF